MRLTHRRPPHVLLAVTLVSALCCSGCSSSSLNDGGGSSSAPLLVGTNVWLGYEPLYLARNLELFDPASIRLVEYTSASQVLRAFRNNTISVAALTLDEVLLLKELGHELKVILVTDVSHGADVILGQAEIQTLGDLQGRSIGVENSALGAFVLARALEMAKLSTSDVDIVPLEVDEHESAFTAGTVDAVVTFEPVRSRLLAKGAVQLFDSTEIPGEIVDVLVVREDVLDKRSDEVANLLKGWFRGLKYLDEHPMDASERMADRMGLSPEDVLAAYQGVRLPSMKDNISMLDGEHAELISTAGRLAKVMKQQKLLQYDLDVSDLFSAELIKGVQSP